MTPQGFDIAVEIIAILLTVLIVLRLLPLIKEGKKPITTALFLFAVVSLLLSIVYWLAYTWINPGTRMPFAANEIGEIAWFLLLAAVLESIFRDSRIPAKKEMFAALIFAAASAALWIAWNGEWLQDIIVGFAFGYYLCICVRTLKQTAALNSKEWLVLGVACLVLILSQTGILLVPESIKKPLDIFCYVLMFAVLIWLLTKSMLMTIRRDDVRATLALSFGACALAFSTLYMSSGWFYLAALLLCLATLPLMFLALRREVTA